MCMQCLIQPVKSNVLFCGLAVAMLAISSLAACSQAQSSGIVINDISTGVPETDGTYDIRVEATSYIGISLVRVYLWFEVPGGITQTQIIALDALATNTYGTTVAVPQNASSMNYYIAAYDTASDGENSDAVERPVKDTYAPVASCAAALQVDMGETLALDGSGSTDNVGIDEYSWALTYDGGPFALSGATASFTFAIPGTYPGTLTVKDAWGNADSAAFTVTVLDPEAPVADAGYELTVYSGNLLFFDGSASTDNYRVSNYTWTLTHNGTQVSLYGQSPEYVFWAPGDYSVTLTVSDTDGNTATDQVPVHVLEASGSGGIEWWVYALAAMIILIVVAGIMIIRT